MRDKVAQMFTFSVFGASLNEDTRFLLTELKAGGLFLGTASLQNTKQVHSLTSELQGLSMTEGSGIPLFISADFVAGAGCKVQGAVHFPKNRAIGAAADEGLAYETGRITAMESLAIGVNFNYSPVVDVNNNPKNPVIGTHSFGADKQLVSRLGNAVIRGYQEHGMIATAKHFPGHGDTHVDSHEDLPVLSFTKERLESMEWVPFRSAISQGADAIMVGHMAVPAIDPSLMPASLSYEITTGLLRKNMQFQGLIVTDGLSMKGITNQFSMEEACIRAVLAGADILLATAEDVQQAASMLEAVVEAVRRGRIPLERIEESYGRIKRMKQKYRLTAQLYRPSVYEEKVFKQRESEETALELASLAATPIGSMRAGVLLEQSDTAWLLICDRHLCVFAEGVRRRLPTIEECLIDSFEEALNQLKSIQPDRNIMLAICHHKPIADNWISLFRNEMKRVNRGLWIHFGSEYDVRDIGIPCLLMYDRAPALQQTAARYLTQE
ncbi:hypothetical protein M6D81_10500 [Paenibacillus sp. J5C_2022]|uniref:glycoside hydrolase family 3 protein n=1 Tax=Paenibacillus sp. J5C2022 TaxID=2977129 RepID=UPI0021CE0D33|nr:glycoside hydrolase family 3 N-terminal domain-containing protein [Paenibacillus sp. J5C2022]MCU6709141.1 hypothetical protein [Paenibacillus sp. J5C2022]